jgi:hypothetical protein
MVSLQVFAEWMEELVSGLSGLSGEARALLMRKGGKEGTPVPPMKVISYIEVIKRQVGSAGEQAEAESAGGYIR